MNIIVLGFFFSIAWMFNHLPERPVWTFVVLLVLYLFITLGTVASSSKKKKDGTHGRH